MYTPILWDTCNMLHYIKFKLLYKFRIVVFFFFFQNTSIMPILGMTPRRGQDVSCPRFYGYYKTLETT